MFTACKNCAAPEPDPLDARDHEREQQQIGQERRKQAGAEREPRLDALGDESDGDMSDEHLSSGSPGRYPAEIGLRSLSRGGEKYHGFESLSLFSGRNREVALENLVADTLHNGPPAMHPHNSASDIPVPEIETGAHSDPLGTLDDFALDPGCTRGVAVDSLETGTRVVVGTSHSCYRFVVSDPSKRRGTVTGGTLFAEPTDVRIDGATAGGTVIKAGWIGVGLRMELTMGSKRITTSCVKFLAVDKVSAAA